MLVINDTNYRQHINPPIIDGSWKSKGYEGMWKPRCRKPKSFRELGIPLIPESEWISRTKQNEESRSNIKSLCVDLGLPCLDQNGTNYCWINAPVHCCEITHLQNTATIISYSPASAGARIKNFRNVGGWGSEGLEWLRQNGVNETSDWPDNAINRSYDTTENRAKALTHRVVEYFVLNSWQEIISCLLSGVPVAVGYNWWSHEVTACDPVVVNNKVELLIRNSWSMSWGEDGGFGVLADSKKYPDDAVAVVTQIYTDVYSSYSSVPVLAL